MVGKITNRKKRDPLGCESHECGMGADLCGENGFLCQDCHLNYMENWRKHYWDWIANNEEGYEAVMGAFISKDPNILEQAWQRRSYGGVNYK